MSSRAEVTCTPYDVECRGRITSFDPLDDKAFALIECSGTLVACEVLDAQPRRVGRQVLKDALDQGGSEATTAIVRIEIQLVEEFDRPTQLDRALPVSALQPSASPESHAFKRTSGSTNFG